jgi:hypothetical protein
VIKPATPHVRRTRVQVENQFGTIFLDTAKADRILVPSTADLGQPGAPPDLSLRDVDPFPCYSASPPGAPEVPQGCGPAWRTPSA